MTDTLSTPLASPRAAPLAAPWPALGAALVLGLLYAPVVGDLHRGLWQTDSHSHGPLVLVVVLLLLARALQRCPAPQAVTAWRSAGGLALGLGAAVLYVVGRSQAFPFLSMASLPPLLAALLLGVGGRPWLRCAGFALFFALFLVPLPGSLTDALTAPLKLGVSWAADALLHAAGLPVARDGVTLMIGPYRLLVADACSGLASLFMLEAFGLLYLHLVRHASALRNVLIGLLIVPISFASNVLRVVMLALVCLHLGDAAALGWFHDFSALILFVPALALTLAADGLIRAGLARNRAAPPPPAREPAPAPPNGWARWPGWATLALTAWAIGCATGALALTPPPTAPSSLTLVLPERIGPWQAIDGADHAAAVALTLPAGGTERDTVRPYDATLMRTYRRADGRIAWIAVAYSSRLEQEVKLHRPELCYAAQGFALGPLPAGGRDATPALPIHRFVARHGPRNEVVGYWLRAGTLQSPNAWAMRWHILREGLAGRTMDGLLVRVSTPLGAGEAAAPDRGALTRLSDEMDALLRATLAALPPEMTMATTTTTTATPAPTAHAAAAAPRP